MYHSSPHTKEPPSPGIGPANKQQELGEGKREQQGMAVGVLLRQFLGG